MNEVIEYGSGDPDVLQMTLRAQRSALLRQMFELTRQCMHLTEVIGDDFKEAVLAETKRLKPEGEARP